MFYVDKKSILVIDDDKDICESIKEALELEGYCAPKI